MQLLIPILWILLHNGFVGENVALATRTYKPLMTMFTPLSQVYLFCKLFLD